ncbi:hypothetical protein IW262DRAFT_266764 [Armillaria fumosa]|nr:hypothetical protein IW262DRAFT_266764 [Armillaria fumosa]
MSPVHVNQLLCLACDVLARFPTATPVSPPQGRRSTVNPPLPATSVFTASGERDGSSVPSQGNQAHTIRQSLEQSRAAGSFRIYISIASVTVEELH